MKFTAFLLVGIIALSCGTTKNNTNSEDMINETNVTSKPERNIKITAEIGDFSDSEPFQILDVRREGNLLFVDINFIGGCGVHEFKVIGNRAIMKSMPPKRSIMVAHSIPRETCQDTVKKVLEIDISALAPSQEAGSTIVLLLEGWNQEINYTFE